MKRLTPVSTAAAGTEKNLIIDFSKMTIHELRIAAISCGLFLLTSFCHSQEYLKGVVMEESDKGNFNALVGVNVFWAGTTQGVYSDVNGVFNIPDDHKNHKLIISYVGYQTDTIEVSDHKELMVVLKNSRVMDAVEIIHRNKATSLSFMDSRHVEVLNEKELFKAACCNLSESFETNASVDASYTDAVSGTRQITMLGLAGIYTQILTENLPGTRGLASVYGLTYVPGAWIESISISKGTGSVLNGYESITGQINTELRKPEQDEALYVNAYGNQAGRMEGNLDYKLKLNERWSTSMLIHGKALKSKNDMNNDGFLDMPLNESVIAMNRWKYTGVKGLRTQFGVKYIDIKNQGGQSVFNPKVSPNDQPAWGNESKTSRTEAFAKIGYVFPEKKYNSIGLQLWGTDHNMRSYYGIRNYNADEKSGYANLIYQTIIGNTNHILKSGVSYLHDDVSETFDTSIFNRVEQVPGAFVEYTHRPNEKITFILGIRADHHNLYDWIYSPRVNLRYGFTENTVVRISAGMGTRIASVLAENTAYMASSRTFNIPGNDKAYGLNPEQALNMGISILQKFKLDYREGSVVIDFYRTEFLEQVLVDLDATPREVNFYNLGNGQSYANSFQVELNYELIKRLDLKLAYRFYDVKSELRQGLLDKALLARHKGFVNLAFETRKNKRFGLWRFDVTTQLVGKQRIPITTTNPPVFQRDEYSSPYLLQSAQVTRVFNKSFELYLGGENLTNYRQKDPIIDPNDPYGNNFDASLIWAPIFGTNVYAGLRFRIN
ncbi:MAG: TonB-dependent receptor [Vicingaceae bacterium]